MEAVDYATLCALLAAAKRPAELATAELALAEYDMTVLARPSFASEPRPLRYWRAYRSWLRDSHRLRVLDATIAKAETTRVTLDALSLVPPKKGPHVPKKTRVIEGLKFEFTTDQVRALYDDAMTRVSAKRAEVDAIAKNHEPHSGECYHDQHIREANTRLDRAAEILALMREHLIEGVYILDPSDVTSIAVLDVDGMITVSPEEDEEPTGILPMQSGGDA